MFLYLLFLRPENTCSSPKLVKNFDTLWSNFYRTLSPTILYEIVRILLITKQGILIVSNIKKTMQCSTSIMLLSTTKVFVVWICLKLFYFLILLSHNPSCVLSHYVSVLELCFNVLQVQACDIL